MDAQQVIAYGQDGLYTMIIVCAPILIVVLVTGLIVSILQAATQIHEATLAFVPKLLAAIATMAVVGPWMISTLVEYLQRMLHAIPGAVT